MESDLIEKIKREQMLLAEKLVIRHLETNLFTAFKAEEDQMAKIINIDEYRSNRVARRWKRKTNTTT